jgi:hypothetical protein
VVAVIRHFQASLPYGMLMGCLGSIRRAGSRSCWLPDNDLTACRDHLADRAPPNNEEHRDARRHQGHLKDQWRHCPMNVNDLGEDCEASKNSDMILKRNLAFAAC